MILALIDVETTGLDPEEHEIIEIGLIVCDSKNFTILDEWDVKIKPEHPETGHPKAFEVNGYNEEEWKDAVTLQQGMDWLARKVPGYTMMSYNVSFDLGFLQAAFKKTGVKDPMNYHRLDLLTLAWSKLPHSKMAGWSLKNVCSFLGIEPEPKVHRGANGARKAYEVYKTLMEV